MLTIAEQWKAYAEDGDIPDLTAAKRAFYAGAMAFYKASFSFGGFTVPGAEYLGPEILAVTGEEKG